MSVDLYNPPNEPIYLMSISSSKKNTCKSCGKVYTKKDSYDKHIILCQFLSLSQKEKEVVIQEMEDIPSYEDLVQIVQRLTIEHYQMKEQIKNLQKTLQQMNPNHKISSKISSHLTTTDKLNWLQENIKPHLHFDEWKQLSFSYIHVKNFNELSSSSLLDYLCTKIIQSTLQTNHIVIPLYGFVSKPNVLYIYKQDFECGEQNIKNYWEKIKDEEVTTLLNDYIKHILNIINNWYKENGEEKINNNQELDDFYKNINNKVFVFDSKNIININKFKKNIIMTGFK
jgi:hypothetical protein